jgi:hypothetical protein
MSFNKIATTIAPPSSLAAGPTVKARQRQANYASRIQQKIKLRPITCRGADNLQLQIRKDFHVISYLFDQSKR